MYLSARIAYEYVLCVLVFDYITTSVLYSLLWLFKREDVYGCVKKKYPSVFIINKIINKSIHSKRIAKG